VTGVCNRREGKEGDPGLASMSWTEHSEAPAQIRKGRNSQKRVPQGKEEERRQVPGWPESQSKRKSHAPQKKSRELAVKRNKSSFSYRRGKDRGRNPDRILARITHKRTRG